MSGDKLQKRMKQYASASIADMLAAAISLSDSHFKYYDSALPVSAAVTDVVVKNGSIEAVKYTVEGDSAERIIQGATLADIAAVKKVGIESVNRNGSGRTVNFTVEGVDGTFENVVLDGNIAKISQNQELFEQILEKERVNVKKELESSSAKGVNALDDIKGALILAASDKGIVEEIANKVSNFENADIQRRNSSEMKALSKLIND